MYTVQFAWGTTTSLRVRPLRPPDALRRRPDTERTCLAVGPTQFTPPRQTRQNSPVCVVSGVAVRIGQLFGL